MLFALLGGRPLHTDALGLVPTSYLPTGGFVHSLDARVDDPSARRPVRRGDHFPLPGLVGDASQGVRYLLLGEFGPLHLVPFFRSGPPKSARPKQRKSPSTAVLAADIVMQPAIGFPGTILIIGERVPEFP